MPKKTSIPDIEIISEEELLKRDKPWEQLPGEPDAWFARLQKYLAMPERPRRTKTFYQQEYNSKHNATDHFLSAMKKYFWRQRADSFDKAIAGEVIAKTYEASVDAGAEVAQETHKIIKQFQTIIKEMLDADLSTKEKREKFQSQYNKITFMTGSGNVMAELMASYKTVIGEKLKIDSTSKEIEVEFE